MTYDIRPLSFGEILDRAFRVYLDNFVLLFGIAAVVWIPSGILQASAVVIGNNAATIIDAIFMLVAAPVMQAALTIGIAEAYLDRPMSIAGAYQSARPILVPFFGTYLLMAVLFLVPGAVVGATLMVSQALFGLLLFVFALVIFYFVGCWSLIGPVMIVERHFGMAALRRSRRIGARFVVANDRNPHHCRTYRWGAGGRPQIRMGIHSGDRIDSHRGDTGGQHRL